MDGTLIICSIISAWFFIGYVKVSIFHQFSPRTADETQAVPSVAIEEEIRSADIPHTPARSVPGSLRIRHLAGYAPCLILIRSGRSAAG